MNLNGAFWRWAAGVTLGLLILAGGWWFVVRERTLAAPSTETLRRGDAVVTTSPSDGTATAAASVEVPGDTLLAQFTEEERWPQTVPGAEQQRWRLLRLAVEPDRLVRVVDHVQPDAVSGGWHLVRQEVMRADSVVVAVPAGATAEEWRQRLRAAGFAAEAGSGGDAVVVVRLMAADLDAVPNALAALASAFPGVVVEPNFVYFPTQAVPDDYNGRVQWGLDAIEAPVGWTIATGSASVVVAIIDTGIDVTHPELAPNLFVNPGEIAGNGIDDDANGFIDDVTGWDFVDGNNTVADDNNHGSHVAGIIGAVGNNGSGQVGVNWNVRLLPLRVGGLTFDSARTLNALRYVNTLRQRGVNIVVVNGSFGGGSFSNAFRDEVTTARDRDVVFIAAAGNDGRNNDVTPFYPANYEVGNIISVGSMHQGSGLSSFSNFGATSVDLVAPGTEVRSTIRNGQFGYLDGTSMAAPHVAGAVALIASVTPGLTAAQMRDRILQATEPVPVLTGRVATGGRLNLRRALAPGLLRPRVAIAAPAADVVVLDRVGLDVAFTATPVADLTTGDLPTIASYTWDVVEGTPAGVIFSSATGETTTATFNQAGIFRIRVRATAGALTEAAEVTVAVRFTGPTAAGLVGFWKFDEGGGSTALDGTSSNRIGTLGTGASRSAGAFYQGVNLNGATSRVSFSAPVLPQISIAGWVRATSAGNSVFPRLAHLRSGLIFLGYDTLATAADGNARNLKFALDDGLDGRVFHSPPDTMATGEWHHVVATFDSAVADNLPQLYVDGRPLVVGVQDSAAGSPTVAAGDGFIGNRADGTRAWEGQIDEVRLYSREITPGEVALLAREATVRAVRSGSFFVTAGADASALPVTFTPGESQINPVTIASVGWSSVGLPLAYSSESTTGAVATATTSGEHLVRLDVTTADRVHVVRTLPLQINLTPVPIAGLYAGTVSGGGVFVLQVATNGAATFLGGPAAGAFATGFSVTPYGMFGPQGEPLSVFNGAIDGAGAVVGRSAEGAFVFTGARVENPVTDGARDGLYQGWLLDTGVAVKALVANGSATIVVQEPGGATSVAGAYAPDGSFTLSPLAGATYAGLIAGGRIDCDVVLPDRAARRAVLFRAGDEPPHGLVNISIRGATRQGDAIVIGGFVIDGGGTLPVLVRGIGPGLAQFQLQGVLAQSRLRLFRDQDPLGENLGWESEGGDAIARLTSAFTRTQAFALTSGSLDAAMLADLGAGGYTAQLTGADGGSGLALIEAYDARLGGETAEIVNLSARGPVGTGDELLIGGFVVGGTAPSLVLVRAIGPGLADFGVPGVLAAPELSVLRGGTTIASSQAWAAGFARVPLQVAAEQASAFPLALTSNDAALLLYLEPGLYTAQVRGADNTIGNALVEVYLVR